MLTYKARRPQVPQHLNIYGLRHENFKCHIQNESDHLKVLNIQGDSRENVFFFFTDDRMGHFEKIEGHVNKCQYVSCCERSLIQSCLNLQMHTIAIRMVISFFFIIWNCQFTIYSQGAISKCVERDDRRE